MGTDDTTAKAKQRRAKDVGPIAPPVVQPPGAKDESE